MGACNRWGSLECGSVLGEIVSLAIPFARRSGFPILRVRNRFTYMYLTEVGMTIQGFPMTKEEACMLSGRKEHFGQTRESTVRIDHWHTVDGDWKDGVANDSRDSNYCIIIGSHLLFGREGSIEWQSRDNNRSL